MGGNKGQGGTSYQQSQVQIPPEVMARYNAVNARAESAAATPWQAYTGEFTAPVNQTQQGGINNITNAAGIDQPYFQQATNVLDQSLGPTGQLYGTAAQQVGQGYGAGAGYTQQGINTAGAATAGAMPFNGLAAGQLNRAYSSAQPLNNAAVGLAAGATGQVNPGQLDIGQYMSPYNEGVVQSTLANLRQDQAIGRADQRDQMIMQGSFGGDRSGVANANLQRQQNLAYGQTAAGLYNANYGQALSAAQQQQGVGLAAGQANRAALASGAQNLSGIGNQIYSQGAGAAQGNLGIGQQVYGQGQGLASAQMQGGNQLYGQGVGAAGANAGLAQGIYGTAAGTANAYGQLGTQQLQNQLAQGTAQVGAGTVQQQTQQAQDTAQYNQFLQQQGYPFQVAQFLANIALGTGAQSGSTTNTVSGSPQPFFSDERLKENVHVIGKTNDGQPIIRFNYKGDPSTQIGLSAQETEKHHPDAVGLAGGYKTVDYDAATRDSIHKAGGGGLGGGMADILAQQRAMFPGGHDPRGITSGVGPHGIPIVPLKGQAPKSASIDMRQPAAQQSGLKQTTDSALGMYNTGKGLASVYSEGKEGLFGKAGTKAPDGTMTNGTSGALGTGGQWNPSEGSVAKFFNDNTKPGSKDAGIHAEPLAPPADPTSPAAPDPSIAAPTVADGGLGIGGTSVADAGAGMGADWMSGLEAFANRGGRIQRAAGGGMPYGEDGGYVPVEEPLDPHKPEEAKVQMGGKGGGQGGGQGGGVGGAAKGAMSGAMAGSMFGPWGMAGGAILGGLGGSGLFERGGRVGYEDGGAPDGLATVPDDNVIDLDAVRHAKFDRPDTFGDLHPRVGLSAGLPPSEPLRTLPGHETPPRVEVPAYEPLRTLPGHALPPALDHRQAPPSPVALSPQQAPPESGTPGVLSDPERDMDLRLNGDGRAPLPGGLAVTPAASTAPPPAKTPIQDQGPPGALNPSISAGGLGTPPAPTRDVYVPPSGVDHSPEAVFGRMTTQESGNNHFNPKTGGPTTSPAGAIGLTQVMPKTGPEAARMAGLPWRPDVFGRGRTGDPTLDREAEDYNRQLGQAYYKEQFKTFGDPYKAAAAYNAGPEAVRIALEKAQKQGGDYLSYLPKETQDYVRIVSGGKAGPVSSLNVGGPQAGLASGAPTGAPPAAGPAQPPEEPDFLDRAGKWIDKHQQGIMTGLSFIGNMLGSKSHQLTGAIGEGLAAAAPMYLSAGFKQQELGQGQERIDITARAQYMGVLAQLQQMQANYQYANKNARSPEIDNQMTAITKLIQGKGGVAATGSPPGPDLRGAPGAPAGGGTPPASLTPGTAPAGGTVQSTPLPPPGGTTPATAPVEPGTYTGGPPQMTPDFLKQLDPDRNPILLREQAKVQRMSPGGIENAKRLEDQARAEEENIIKTGQGIGPGNTQVRLPGWDSYQAQQKNILTNQDWLQKAEPQTQARVQARQNVEQIKNLIENFESGTGTDIKAQVAGVADAVGLPRPQTATMDQTAFKSFVKDAYNQILASGAMGRDTDQMRQQVEGAFAGPTLPPEANKKILAQFLGNLSYEDAYAENMANAIKKNQLTDQKIVGDQWRAADREKNNPEYYRGEAYKNIAALGATPESKAELKPDHVYMLTPEQVFRFMGDGAPPLPTIKQAFADEKKRAIKYRVKRDEAGNTIIQRVK